MRSWRLAGGIVLSGLAVGAAHAQTGKSLTAATREAVMLSPRTASPARAAPGRVSRRSDIVSTSAGPADRRSASVSRKARGRAVDTLTITTASSLRTPGYGAVAPSGARADQAQEVTYVREWREAARVSAGRYQVAVTPLAGVGFGGVGGSAQAGAIVVVSPAERDARLVQRLKKLGFAEGDAVYSDDQGRWYLFAAAKGRAVGLNMAGGDRALSTDPVALAAEAQAGIGWRRGEFQASVGYSRRNMRTRDTYMNMITPSRDEMVGISLSLKPGL